MLYLFFDYYLSRVGMIVLYAVCGLFYEVGYL